MVYSSRVLALLLALCIALITTLFLSLFDSASSGLLLVAFGISFSVAYLLTFVVLEFLIFREINRIYKLVTKLKKKEFAHLDKQSSSLNPLKTINEDIYSFAEVKQKEIDELKKLEAFRREFIADVSHELKTPIFAAQGFVHTLLDGAVNDRAVRTKFLKKAAKSLDGLDMLVQDLLTLSHIETGQIKMHFENIDLYHLTEEVFEQFEGKADKKDVSLSIAGSETKVMVYADWQRISQVMTNLISNAIKHSQDGSDVIVSFDVTKKNVVTSVRDAGEGIPAEHLGRIFERFYRVDKSRSREKGGTGLGLSIVKHILDGHNTKAEVKSEPGAGSVFSFKLPRAKPEVTDLEED
ncbi:sensor histidine kinase [Pseudochryseolinea flava]|uniref:histidine kinase n=1 Tax=Pseudochryseolinea flava TaxID=2059302 RepID=A0A364XWG4_9BACT|nr:ATP-binding protein [Pseudochryseolinea flava]RAV98298.1 two-component sensor histidine kinase [Pseudochryseolinea flava]